MAATNMENEQISKEKLEQYVERTQPYTELVQEDLDPSIIGQSRTRSIKSVLTIKNKVWKSKKF